ncbi:hybrid sensor histidine kinase/response regulator [Dyadobacter chenhuakuii]|uniref:histidine kinase n=1 Tax=Dyadobacter chenhuakuii TaxID=2909339 RepID=A0ABY4XPG3_9BACT|nr:response regulator [Dyadobacter chenhuakuii]MCF2494566.1 response regulator [Dyadobacter chenhuakuii]USJ32111.1 response regulator [Dyadobacter chenhuakuii]
MILIVDDRPENILPLKKILELHDFKTDSAESGEEALKKILKNSYSVIIMDVQMPGMDGFEVAEAISGFGKAKDTPIIFLSAVNKEKKFITKGYSSGGIDYLTKPVDADILLLKVKTFYKLYEQQQELKAIQHSLQYEIEIRKKAQEELAGRMEELRVILESLPQIAFTIGVDGKIEFVNEHWFQVSADANVFPESHPEDNLYERWETSFRNGQEFTGEARLRHLETQEYKYFLIKIIPILQNGITIRWVGTFTDIHQQKMANELLEHKVEVRTKELLDKNSELETTNHELQQFAWVVSHDLKEPLRKIQTFSHLVKDKYLNENAEAVSYLNRSISSSARMSRLISDLLDYSRLSVKAHFQPTDLNSLLDDLLSDFDEIILNKQAEIRISKLPIIDTIPSQIRQVFQNLISNALKFSKEGIPPVINVTSTIIADKHVDAAEHYEGQYCKIVIEDNGIGFDEKFLDRIFVIFQRLNNMNSYEGTGIGLAIAKKIMDKHNGVISARSAENRGAQFILILPLVQEQALNEIKTEKSAISADEKNL